MWLAGRLVPDHKTIADFHKDNGPAIRKVCAQFVAVCRKIPGPAIAVKTEFLWEVPIYFDVDARGIGLSSSFAPTAKLGSGSFYLGTYHDSSGKPLRGENTYRLRVPANVPVREFWALTVYSLETAALFRNSERLTLGSLGLPPEK